MRKAVLVFGLWSIPVLALDPEIPGFTRYGDMLVYNEKTLEPHAAAAAKEDVELWEDGVLPFVFDDSISSARREQLLSACAEWSEVADVRCQEGPYKKRQLSVSAHQAMGCFSIWGMGPAFEFLGRMMNLADGCWRHATLLHELGHAFGLIHEHQRPDRDQYVTIHPENVQSGFLGLQVSVNFNTQAVELESPYDFLSIMHYSRTAFSTNGKDTIVPKDPYLRFMNIMGRVDKISEHDAEIMAELYGPAGK